MIKKYLLIFILSIFATSCSKKVDFTATIKGGSPLERIEFIEASGVATLPLVNVGIGKDGKFTGGFDAPNDGMYVITYAGKENIIYLKQGQKLEISGNGETFPQEFKIVGDAKNNNDFLQAVQKFMQNYTKNLDLQSKMSKDEKTFLAALKKIEADLMKSIDENGEKFSADKKVIEWKKNDIRTGMLSIFPQYEGFKKQSSGNPAFKISKEFADYEESLQKDKELLVKEHPAYRTYLLTKMSEDFSKFAEGKTKGLTIQPTTSELFAEYLKKRTELSDTAKDYLLAYIISQADLQPTATQEVQDKIGKIIDADIKDASIKKDLKTIQFAIGGLKVGEALPEASLMTADGKPFKTADFNGKPTLLMFYASWTPYIKDQTVPILNQVIGFYKKDMNFAFINFDDNKEQFTKTSSALMKGIPGTNYYAEGGLTGDFAKKFGIYGFKLQPSFVIVDKNGKVASRLFFNLGDPEMVTALDKATGLTAPAVQQPEIQLQNDINAPKAEAPTAEAPQNAPAPAAPATK
ncbi:TlpA family protein disulfide reductase [Frigoriflavimonas asaccharolytica]|uniref:Thiol-disulfide isomerase/thioredoxin n=1 Tax=Frigoriflavimonas asaccharolytica TaxID=2735899 RepID=A0A8J8GCD3_9FLAO|nr:TlpA disulfide reductase family protein [Frigoriflavimonas asaccharolytica]NRS93927.1 thiol-disulfide isomerase/thioredoxin [Frigoriflavimonas asaccharolytica]